MRSIFVILLLVVAGFAARQMIQDDAAPPVTTPGRASDDTAVVDPGTTDPGTKAAQRPSATNPSGSSRAAVRSATIGLSGTAIDHRDQPLCGLSIRLLAEGARDHEALWSKTDGQGQFAFPDVHGSFACTLWNHVRVTTMVTIARGDHKHIVLKVEEPCVLVTGTVRSGARPVTDRTIAVHGKDNHGDARHDAHTDEHGVYRHLLRPGCYEISVAGPPTSIAWNIKGTTVWAETATEAMVTEQLILAAVPTRMRRDFQLPSAAVNVRARTPNGDPIGDASVTIRSTEGEHLAWTRRTDEGDGTITFEELPAGTWKVTALHRMHLPNEPQIVTTRTGEGAQTLTIPMVRAGSALVQLTQNGEAKEPLDPSMLELHIAGREPMRGGRAEGSMWIYRGTHFEAVPTGTHELHCTDTRLPDGSIRFAPIEPISPRRITIEPGKTVEATLDVVLRPHLVISVVGGPEIDTTIEVVSSQGRVVPSRRGHDHWRAEVPAGDYTVRVKRGDLEHCDQVSVFQADVEHVVRLGP